MPLCYAMVVPGLETVAAEEIREALDADVKRTSRGIVVFRAPRIDKSLLTLRTTEDVFLLAWGTDELTYRAGDLEQIRRWTAREAAWDRLLQLHHAIRPKPKGKPTFRLVVQMRGEHGYRRIDAQKALVRGLAGKLPSGWRHVEEDAAIEIWLTIQGATAVCGLRLSDRTMRHRRYKLDHLPASLRPTVAAAMVRLAGIAERGALTVVDPMCGAGTILAEATLGRRRSESVGGAHPTSLRVLGGDIDPAALRAARANLSRLEPTGLVRWDARRLPLADARVDRVMCNLPFGVKLEKPADIPRLYKRVMPELDRVLCPGGRAVLLAADVGALQDAVRSLPWKPTRQVRLRVLGQPATMSVYHKAG